MKIGSFAAVIALSSSLCLFGCSVNTIDSTNSYSGSELGENDSQSRNEEEAPKTVDSTMESGSAYSSQTIVATFCNVSFPIPGNWVLSDKTNETSIVYESPNGNGMIQVTVTDAWETFYNGMSELTPDEPKNAIDFLVADSQMQVFVDEGLAFDAERAEIGGSEGCIAGYIQNNMGGCIATACLAPDTVVTIVASLNAEACDDDELNDLIEYFSSVCVEIKLD